MKLAILIIFFLNYFNVQTSVLNIEELNSIHYNIDIANSPVLKDQEWTSNIVKVTNKHGQEYICTLPEVTIPEHESKKEEDLLDQLVDISELLKPMESAPCLIKKKDWWSYEFCYGSVIKQYHLEDNKVVGNILILGKYESEYNWKNNSKTKNKLQKFHTQSYVNGTRCDITGEPRRAEVRFHCEEGMGDYIQQVDEPESCRYVITIATTRVCHHPYLKPIPNRTPHSINCAPALNQDEFEKYQKIQEIKKEKLEKERQKLLDVDKPKSDLAQRGDLVNTLGDNETEDDDAKWSIKLVTIPISKKGKILRNKVSSEDIENLNVEADILSPSTFTKNEEMVPSEKSQILENVESYLKENELLDKEINEIMKEYLHETKEIEEDIQKNDKVAKKELHEKENELEQHLQEFKELKKRLEYLMGKWMEVQKEENLREVVDNMKNSLEGLNRDSDDSEKDSTEEGGSLNTYLSNLLEMMETYKKNAINQRKRLEDFQKYLETTLKETNKQIITSMDDNDGTIEEEIQDVEGVDPEGDRTHLSGIPDTDESSPSSLSTQPEPSSPPNPNTPQRLEDPIDASDQEGRESQSSTGEKATEDVLEADGSSRHLKILDERTINDDRKHRLEQTIKERLQKSGLDNIGRKIEVKILTPNYMDDDEKDTLSSLSQEETEAFHNMIVNILSASAEELHERERHKSLESNYNFQVEEPDVQLEETTEKVEESRRTEETVLYSDAMETLGGIEPMGKENNDIGGIEPMGEGNDNTLDGDNNEDLEDDDISEDLVKELELFESQTEDFKEPVSETSEEQTQSQEDEKVISNIDSSSSSSNSKSSSVSDNSNNNNNNINNKKDDNAIDDES